MRLCFFNYHFFLRCREMCPTSSRGSLRSPYKWLYFFLLRCLLIINYSYSMPAGIGLSTECSTLSLFVSLPIVSVNTQTRHLFLGSRVSFSVSPSVGVPILDVVDVSPAPISLFYLFQVASSHLVVMSKLLFEYGHKTSWAFSGRTTTQLIVYP